MPGRVQIPLGRLATAGAEQVPRCHLVGHRLVATELACVRSIHRSLIQAHGRLDATVETRQLSLHEQLQM